MHRAYSTPNSNPAYYTYALVIKQSQDRGLDLLRIFKVPMFRSTAHVWNLIDVLCTLEIEHDLLGIMFRNEFIRNTCLKLNLIHCAWNRTTPNLIFRIYCACKRWKLYNYQWTDKCWLARWKIEKPLHCKAHDVKLSIANVKQKGAFILKKNNFHRRSAIISRNVKMKRGHKGRTNTVTNTHCTALAQILKTGGKKSFIGKCASIHTSISDQKHRGLICAAAAAAACGLFRVVNHLVLRPLRDNADIYTERDEKLYGDAKRDEISARCAARDRKIFRYWHFSRHEHRVFVIVLLRPSTIVWLFSDRSVYLWLPADRFIACVWITFVDIPERYKERCRVFDGGSYDLF